MAVNPAEAEIDNETLESPAPEATAASPPAADDGPKSILDAVVAAVADEKPEPKAAPEKAEAVAEAAEAAPAEKTAATAAPTEAELATMAEPVRNQVKSLLQSRSDLQTRVAEMEPLAAAGRGITEYMQRTGVAAEEVNGLLTLGSLLRTDPEKAYQALLPVVADLLQVTGRQLPADLAQDVREGHLTQERALELSRARASEKLATGRVERVEKTTETERAESANAKFVSDISVAVSRWETGVKGADADYEFKRQRVSDKIENRILKGDKPKTVADAVKMAKECYAEVNAETAKIVPMRKPVEAPVANGRGANRQAKPTPTSTLEAMQQAI